MISHCKLLFMSQVRQFYLKQQKQKAMLEHRDQERLANLRTIMEEQMRRDKERSVHLHFHLLTASELTTA